MAIPFMNDCADQLYAVGSSSEESGITTTPVGIIEGGTFPLTTAMSLDDWEAILSLKKYLVFLSVLFKPISRQDLVKIG
jgi:hypothetical protein